MDNYRLYTFVNHVYMSPLQWGIQTAHVVSTLMSDPRFKDREDVQQWAKESPTIIVCKGGNVAGITSIYEELSVRGEFLDLPYASFKEDNDSLGGILTCAGILVPKKFFSAQIETYTTYEELGVEFYYRDGIDVWVNTTQEYFLINRIQNAKLA